MYEEYPKEILEQIKELGLWGKSLEEIIKISINACDDIKKECGPMPTKFKKNVEELQLNQLLILEKLKNIHGTNC